MTFERARTSEQIQARIDEIIQISIEIFEKDGIDKLNFFEIAKKTKFTRPTIYKYFKTKEEIMLQLIVHYMKNYASYLETFFNEDRIYTNEEIAETITQAFCRAPHFMELYTHLYTVIEKHVSIQAFAQYQAEIIYSHRHLLQVIKKSTKCTSEAKIREFLLMSLSLAIGLYPMCFVSDKKRQAILESNTGYEIPDFTVIYKNVVFTQLNALHSTD